MVARVSPWQQIERLAAGARRAPVFCDAGGRRLDSFVTFFLNEKGRQRGVQYATAWLLRQGIVAELGLNGRYRPVTFRHIQYRGASAAWQVRRSEVPAAANGSELPLQSKYTRTFNSTTGLCGSALSRR